MHSPGVLGYFIYLPVVFWLADPRLSTLLSAGLASVTLLLSQVRSAWTALAVSAVLLLFVMRMGKGLRVLVFAGIGALCVAPLLRLPDVSERVNARVETFKDMPNFDTSASARTEGYVLTLDFMTRHPFGAGVGANPTELDVVGVRDSTVISGLVQFGIIGMCVYGAGIVLMIGSIWQYYRSAPGPAGLGLAAAALGMLSIMALGIPTAAQPGVFTWLVAGLATARASERRVAHADRAVERFDHAGVADLAPAGGR
ncbi:MAG: O-antigen ligase family protein [Vicinamibacterales bacterium]